MRKIAAVLGIIVIFCTACGKVDSQSIQNNTYENTTDEEITKFDLYDGRIDVDNSYDGIAGGFYICDENKQPILNNQIIESDSDMKFYMKVANPGTKKINYAISVIINDCYQNLNVIKKMEIKISLQTEVWNPDRQRRWNWNLNCNSIKDTLVRTES